MLYTRKSWKKLMQSNKQISNSDLCHAVRWGNVRVGEEAGRILLKQNPNHYELGHIIIYVKALHKEAGVLLKELIEKD